MNNIVELLNMNHNYENIERSTINEKRFKTDDFIKFLEKNNKEIKEKPENKLNVKVLKKGEKGKVYEELLENIIPYYLNLTIVEDMSKFPTQLEKASEILGTIENKNFEQFSEILYFIKSNINSVDELEYLEKEGFVENLKSILFINKNILEETKNDNGILAMNNVDEPIEEIIEKLNIKNHSSDKSKFITKEDYDFKEVKISNKDELMAKASILNKDEDISKDRVEKTIITKGISEENIDEIDEELNPYDDSVNNKYKSGEIEELDTEETIDEYPIIHINKGVLFKNKLELRPKVIKTTNNELLDKEDIVKQIIDKAKLIVDEKKPEIHVKLKPEILGELILEVEVEEGLVLAKALVDNYRTKELLETNIVELKEGLKEQGLEIKTFEVSIGSNRDFDQRGREGFANNPKQKLNKVIVEDEDLEKASVFYEDNTIQDKGIVFGDSTIDLMA